MISPHVDRGTAPPGVTDDSPHRLCCYGEAFGGPMRCTCWEPVYDVEQTPPADGGAPPTEEEIPTRSKCCHDCAYRNGSPERERGEGEQLDDWALDGRSEFWCHQGVRRIVAYRHPDGTVLPAGDGEYAPPQGSDPLRPVVFKADGTIGERCAGWAATRKGAR